MKTINLRILQLCFTFCLLLSRGVQAQTDTDILLASEYYQQGDYEKAYTLYQKLSKYQHIIYEIHKNYVDVLLKLQKTDEAEKYLKKQAKNFPYEGMFVVDYGMLLIQQGKPKEANKVFEEFIETIRKDDNQIRNNARYFINASQYDYAEKLYLAGRKNGKDKFVYELAGLYSLSGKTDQMIAEYLEILSYAPDNIDYVQNVLQVRLRDDEDYEKLEAQLVELIQKNPEQSAYSELMIWYFLQRKEFYRAFLQAKALDKRKGLEGTEIYNIGELAYRNKDFGAAVKIFDYLTNSYKEQMIYPLARRMLVKSREEQVKNTFPVDMVKIRTLANDYATMIQELGVRQQTAEAFRSLAQLQAFYLQNKDTAIVLLQQVINGRMNGISQDMIDGTKLDLGDIYLLKSEPWEATLLYSQVEKSAKETNLGHQAKLRNAKLYYYKGDFEYAKGQLDVLKQATTREISNDAMQLSLLISDNLELDTSATALTEFANIDLIVYQGQLETALQQYDAFLKKYNGHSLTDEVLWAKANIYIKQGRWQEAVQALDQLMKEYSDDILADDANFTLAKIYEENIKDKNKAMELYQKQLTQFTNSVFTAEARKRFRALRGDVLN